MPLTSIPYWGSGRRFRGSLTGKSISLSFRVRVVRASGRGEAAWAREGSASSSLGLWVANYAAARPAFGAIFLCSGMWVLTVLGAFSVH